MAQPAHELNDLPELFWAWLAGFIDGDGCIGMYGERGYRRPRVQITQKKRHVLDVIVQRLGVGQVRRRSLRENERYHEVNFGNAASKTICERILPYLVTKQKRERALVGVAWKAIERDARKNAMVKNPLYSLAIAMYREGHGMPTIAAEIGVSEVCVLKWLRRAGVPRRSHSEAQKLRYAREAQR